MRIKINPDGHTLPYLKNREFDLLDNESDLPVVRLSTHERLSDLRDRAELDAAHLALARRFAASDNMLAALKDADEFLDGLPNNEMN